MTVDEVRQLLGHVLPVRATDELAQHLHDRTGGNGLFLRLELELAAEGRLGRDVQPTVLHAVHERTAAFSRATREVLHTAALLGQSFPLAPLAAIHPNLRGALGDAVDEGLLQLDAAAATTTPAPSCTAWWSTPWWSCSPRPCGSCATTSCGPSWRPAASAVALAHQALGAADLDPFRAVRACLEAAASEALVFEWAAAIEWARHGLATIERFDLDDAGHEATLRLVAGRGLRRLNRAGSGTELLAAAERAATAGDDERYVEVATELCLHGGTTQAGSVDATRRRPPGAGPGPERGRPAAGPADVGRRHPAGHLRRERAGSAALPPGHGAGRRQRRSGHPAHRADERPPGPPPPRRPRPAAPGGGRHRRLRRPRGPVGEPLPGLRPGPDRRRPARPRPAVDDLHQLTSAVRQRDHQQSLRQVESRPRLRTGRSRRGRRPGRGGAAAPAWRRSRRRGRPASTTP